MPPSESDSAPSSPASALRSASVRRGGLAARLALVTAGPLLLALAGLQHPAGLNSRTAAAWAQQHVWLVPVWPLLAAGLVVPLWGRPRRDAAGGATVVAWAGAFGYGVFYTALDTIAGIAAGTAHQHAGDHPRTVVNPLFHIGDRLGHTGVWCLGAGVLAASLALFLRRGPRVLPGAAVLLLCCWSFYTSHIFYPRGVGTMLGFAAGFAYVTWASESRGAGGGRGR